MTTGHVMEAVAVVLAEEGTCIFLFLAVIYCLDHSHITLFHRADFSVVVAVEVPERVALYAVVTL